MTNPGPGRGHRLADRCRQRLRPAWRHLKAEIKLIRYSWHDYQQYRRFSAAINKSDREGQAAQIIKYYHMIEKGLALPDPRPSFGHYAIEGLCAMVERQISAGVTASYLGEAIEVLQAYRDFNLRTGGITPRMVDPLIARALAAGIGGAAEAVRRVHRAVIEQAVSYDTTAFFLTRFSVRQFAPLAIDRAKIEVAARIAQSAPSVCNRQAGRIHIVEDPAERERWLGFQNGNRGFGDTIGALAVVTVDLRAFVEPEERFQGWVDGGLFAMNFILGLHAQRLGTCCLNWSTPSANDTAFHYVSGIPHNESVIMFLAIGELRDEFVVARSPRKPLSDVLHFVK